MNKYQTILSKYVIHTEENDYSTRHYLPTKLSSYFSYSKMKTDTGLYIGEQIYKSYICCRYRRYPQRLGSKIYPIFYSHLSSSEQVNYLKIWVTLIQLSNNIHDGIQS